MQSVDILIETPVGASARCRQLEGMFDVPRQDVARLTWKGEIPLDERDWNVGLIVGPSGCGKSTLLRRLFDAPPSKAWGGASVIDDFAPALAMNDIAAACQAVGFNTIPAWLRPYAVLSNGERFRVELARRLLEDQGVIVVDEFTSIVDRQVAKIGAHAMQKAVRKSGRRFVAASCHFDIVDWLQPDWILEPATMAFQWRELRRHPPLAIELRRVRHSLWKLFAPFHYLTADLANAAQCWCLFIEGRPTSFAGVLHRPHQRRGDIKGISRLVTLPDWQGLGLAMILSDLIGSLYKAAGYELRMYPAHPALIRSFDHSGHWRLEKKPGHYSPKTMNIGGFGSRPCAVFSYCAEPMDRPEALRALAD